MGIKEVLSQITESQEGVTSWKMDYSVNFPFHAPLPFLKKGGVLFFCIIYNIREFIFPF